MFGYHLTCHLEDVSGPLAGVHGLFNAVTSRLTDLCKPDIPASPPLPLTCPPAHIPDWLLVFLVLFALCYPDATLLGSRAT